jgi:hypothetical protein
MLKKSIQIFLPESGEDDKNPRMWLSSGTYSASDSSFDGRCYRTNAFLPQSPWRQPTSDELRLLLPMPKDGSELAPWNIGSSLGVVRIPPDCLSPLERLNLNAIETIEDRVITPDEQVAVAEVRDRILGYCQGSSKTEMLGINTSSPNMTTTTIYERIDTDRQTYAGMHLDSWDKLPLKHRSKSKNRLCINLGREDRFFLFINLTLMDMFYALGLSEDRDIHKYYRALKLPEKFMSKNPEYPVVKLRVSPGEAYIAPTENMIHDATNQGTHYPDLTLTFLGHFGIQNGNESKELSTVN